MAGKRGRGRPGEEGFFSPAAPLFSFPPSLRLFGRLGEGPCRREAGGAGGKALGSGGRRSGAGQAGAGRRAGRGAARGGRAAAGPRGSLAGVPGGGQGGQGPWRGCASDSRFPSPGPREDPWKKLKCRGLVGPAGGVLRLAGPGDLPRGYVPRGPRSREPRGPGVSSPPGLGARWETLAKFPGSFGLWLRG